MNYNCIAPYQLETFDQINFGGIPCLFALGIKKFILILFCFGVLRQDFSAKAGLMYEVRSRKAWSTQRYQLFFNFLEFSILHVGLIFFSAHRHGCHISELLSHQFCYLNSLNFKGNFLSFPNLFNIYVIYMYTYVFIYNFIQRYIFIHI